ncbi:twin-arginine translocase TatA/TatE family subunit [Erwinia sp. V71]|uniref:twin-arginine translocase TatA/TatE family subunit n=1 Tax=Erwinia sp. V71 TaxID=3369424 RepID=UPI003F62B471
MGSIGFGQLLIIAVIVVLLFGTKKLRGLGSDLGESLKGFKKAMGDDNQKDKDADDADFSAKTLADKQHTDAKSEEAKQDKDKV